MATPRVGTREEWLEARRALLVKEKELTAARDALSAERRALPMVRVEKPYEFVGSDGTRSLSDLFGQRSQLAVYHFMFGPSWEEGCPSCSFWADNFNGVSEHLAARDVSMVAVSSAPLASLEAYKKRMGWGFEWLSSGGCDFNQDFQVTFAKDARESASYNFKDDVKVGEEMPGASAFLKDEHGHVFHTYSTYSRGLDMLNGAYHWLDLMPKGRDESELPWPMAWLKRRDKY